MRDTFGSTACADPWRTRTWNNPVGWQPVLVSHASYRTFPLLLFPAPVPALAPLMRMEEDGMAE